MDSLAQTSPTPLMAQPFEFVSLEKHGHYHPITQDVCEVRGPAWPRTAWEGLPLRGFLPIASLPCLAERWRRVDPWPLPLQPQDLRGWYRRAHAAARRWLRADAPRPLWVLPLLPTCAQRDGSTTITTASPPSRRGSLPRGVPCAKTSSAQASVPRTAYPPGRKIPPGSRNGRGTRVPMPELVITRDLCVW